MPKIELEILQDLTPLKVGLNETINELRTQSAALGRDMSNAFNNSEKQAREFDNELKKGVNDLGKIEQQTKKNSIAVNETFRSYKNATGEINKLVLKEKALTEARNRSNNVKSIAKYNDLIKQNQKEIEKLTTSTNKQTEATKKLATQTSSVGNTLTNLVTGIGIASLGKEIIKTTSEFEKFEAVLTNTLGSKGLAQQNLEAIKQFAAETPFSVSELTESFVKLANQGFIPSTEELRKLGDLAASTGKGFDQLSEAIIDAQTGEFERLKEFGIRAEKQGDKVTFAFKGVKKQVDFTSESIQRYILGLGDAEGVSGSMAAISETLGGKISNLGDKWDNFLNTVGSDTGPVLSGAIDFLGLLLDGAKGFISGLSGLFTGASFGKINVGTVVSAASAGVLEKDLDRIQAAATRVAKAGLEISDPYELGSQRIAKEFTNIALSYENLSNMITKNSSTAQNETIIGAFRSEAERLKTASDAGTLSLKDYTIQLALLNEQYKLAKDRQKLFNNGVKPDPSAIGIIGRLKKEIEDLQKKQEGAKDVPTIKKLGAEIEAKQKQLNDLLGKNANERKKMLEDLAKELLELTNRASKAEIDMLTGTERVLAQKKFDEAEIAALRKKIEDKGKLTDKNFKFSATQEEQFALLQVEINKKAADEIIKIELDKLQKVVDAENQIAQARVQSASGQLSNLNTRETNAISTVELTARPAAIDEATFETQKQKQIIEVKQRFVDERLALQLKLLEAEQAVTVKQANGELALLEGKEDEATRIKREGIIERLELSMQGYAEDRIAIQDATAKIVNDLSTQKEQLNKGKQFSLREFFGLTEEEGEALQLAMEEVTKAFSQILQNEIDLSTRQIQQSQEKSAQYQKEIDSLSSKIDGEQRLADKGKANNIKRINAEIQQKEAAKRREEESERKALARRKELQRQQLIIDSITQASNIITASTQILSKTQDAITLAINLGTVAAMIAGFVASKASAFQAIKENNEFYDGGYTGDGGKYEEAGTVHKGEFVTTKENTKKHRTLLEGIHDGDPLLIKKGIQELIAGKNIVLESDLPKKIQGQKEDIRKGEIINYYTNDFSKLEGKFDKNNEMMKTLVDHQKQKTYLDAEGNLVIQKGSYKKIIRK